jgi:hypothetical protein
MLGWGEGQKGHEEEQVPMLPSTASEFETKRKLQEWGLQTPEIKALAKCLLHGGRGRKGSGVLGKSGFLGQAGWGWDS